ncbi:hypothetical protein PMZ80_003772, partial [Knufia obscura]
KTFAMSLDEQSASDVWSFGQIIAVVVFLPVLSEMLYQYLDNPRPSGAVVQQHTTALQLNVPSHKPGTAQTWS